MILSKQNIERLIPFSIHDGSICDVKWDGDELYVHIETCANDRSGIKSVSLCFSGVEWIRSVCDEKHDGYIDGTSYDEYPLIDRDKLNENFIEYVCYGLLDDITLIDDDIVGINQVFFFNATAVDVLKISE